MIDSSSSDIQILHVIYADAIGFTTLSHQDKRQFDTILNDVVAQQSERFQIIARVDNGDGFALVLEGNPERVAQLASQLREDIQERSEIRVKIGIHTGPGSLRPDLSGSASITGNAIEQAQRVMGLSNGKSIVCSEAFAHNLLAINPNRTDLGLPTLGVSKSGELLVGFEIGANPSKQCLVLADPADRDARQIVDVLRSRLPEWNFLTVSPGLESDSLAVMTRFRSRASSVVFFQGSIATDHLPTFASAHGVQWQIFVGDCPSSIAGEGFKVIPRSNLEVDTVRLQVALCGASNSVTLEGPLPLDSPYYVVRAADQELAAALASRESVVLLKAPTGFGKTSAILRVIKQAYDDNRLTIIIDLDSADESVLSSPTAFYRWLIGKLFENVKGGHTPPPWEDWLGPNSNLERAVNQLIINRRKGALIIFDGIDRLFQYQFRDDFFGLLRSWHNMRAMREDSAWTSLTMLLSYSSEGQSFVSDVNQSPFNVGTLITLKPFDEQDIAKLIAFSGAKAWNKLYELTNGHPALTMGVLDSLARDSSPTIGSAIDCNQRFLKRVRRKLISDPSARGLKEFSFLDKCTDQRTLWSLLALGILSVQPDGSIGYSNPIFRNYFDHV